MVNTVDSKVQLNKPNTGPRVVPLHMPQVSPYVRAEYDKSLHTWGIHNNLIRTMAWLPQLALTEIAYANSFIFDEGSYIHWPRPGDPTKTVLWPAAGFVDRVTKELVINLVSLLNRSRYSITHHSFIGFMTISGSLGSNASAAKIAEMMLLNLANEKAEPTFEGQKVDGKDLYDDFQLGSLRLALKMQRDPHVVSDSDFNSLKSVYRKKAEHDIKTSILNSQLDGTNDEAFHQAYVNAMLVEMTWCIAHFSGLLNSWFTILKVADEDDQEIYGIDFFENYNQTVPASIKERNNKILGSSGWGV